MQVSSATYRDSTIRKPRLQEHRAALAGRIRTFHLVGVLVLALLALARPAAAAVAYVQSAAQVPASTNSVTVNLAAAQNAGDLNVVVLGWTDTTSSVSSIVDTSGNSYAVAGSPIVGTNATQVVFYAPNIAAAAAGANTVTVTFGNAVTPDVRVLEYSGLSTSAPLDVTIGSNGSGTTLSSGLVTTLNANDLLVGAAFTAGSYAAAGAGYTARIVTSLNTDLVEDTVVTAAGSYSATSTQTSSGWWLMQLVAFSASTDTQPPTAPSSLTATAASSTQIDLSWTASTDDVGVTGYLIQRCLGASCTNFSPLVTVTGTTTTYSDSGLPPSTSYSYQVQATDAAGNLGPYSNASSATTSGDRPPTAPSGLTATAASDTQINLSWTASTDDVGVTGYLIERCQSSGCSVFTQIGSTTTGSTTTFSDSGLTPSTSYSYQVRATDAAGNYSPYSNISTATTALDKAPTAPSSLTATAASSTQIDLSWTASTDDVGVTGYLIQRCLGASCTNFSPLVTVTGTTTTYSDSGLPPSTSYSYRVRATDAAGNLGPYSNVSTATTLGRYHAADATLGSDGHRGFGYPDQPELDRLDR